MIPLVIHTLLLCASFVSAYNQTVFHAITNNVTLNRPVYSQFYPSNRAIATLIVANNSVLPAGLYQPSAWSFSIGFVWDTYLLKDGMETVHYTGTLADGSKLPSWVTFSKSDITFQGSPPKLKAYTTYQFALRASNDDGLELGREIFNFTVASRDVSVTTTTLPALNMTANAPFSESLENLVLPYVRIDGKPAFKSQLDSLNFTLAAGNPSWASYSGGKLQGVAPSSTPSPLLISMRDGLGGASTHEPLILTIPVTLGSSFFSGATIPAQSTQEGGNFQLALTPYMSNTTSPQQVYLSASFEPKSTSWLLVDTSPPVLHGTVPNGLSTSHVNVTLMALDKATNATSTTSVYISVTNGASAHPGAAAHSHASTSSHSRTVIAAVLGVIGGFALLCCCVALVRHSVGGQKAEDAKVLSGRRQSTPGLKEYVIDQMDNPMRRDFQDPAPFFPDDLESHSGSVGTGDVLSGAPRAPERAHVVEPSLTSMPSPSGRLSKREFFKPSLYHPARFLRPQPVQEDAPRKPSGSSFRNVMQSTLRSLRGSRDRPEISKPLPFTGNMRPGVSSASNSQEKLSSSSTRSLDKNAPPIPSRSVHSFAAPYSQTTGPVPAVPSQFTMESSLEGGVSIAGHSTEGHGIVDTSSHVWAHRQRTDGSNGSGSGGNSGTSSAQQSGSLSGLPAAKVRRSLTPPSSRKPVGGGRLPEAASEEFEDEAVVTTARTVNVLEHPRASREGKWDSLNSALQDPHGYTTSSNAFQSTNTMKYSQGMTGPASSSSSSGSSGRSGPVVVQTQQVRQHVPNVQRPDVRNVSDRAEIGNALLKNPIAAASSYVLPKAESESNGAWFY